MDSPHDQLRLTNPNRRRSFATTSLVLSWFCFVLLAMAASLVLAIQVKERLLRIGAAPTRQLFGADAEVSGWPIAPPVPWPPVENHQESTAFAFRRVVALAGANGEYTHRMSFSTYGWPLPAMQEAAQWSKVSNPDGTATNAAQTDGARIRWAGLLLDSLLLGSGMWGMVVGVPWIALATRAWRRRNAGRCVRCNHMLAHATTCPECGRAVESRHASR